LQIGRCPAISPNPSHPCLTHGELPCLIARGATNVMRCNQITSREDATSDAVWGHLVRSMYRAASCSLGTHVVGAELAVFEAMPRQLGCDSTSVKTQWSQKSISCASSRHRRGDVLTTTATAALHRGCRGCRGLQAIANKDLHGDMRFSSKKSAWTPHGDRASLIAVCPALNPACDAAMLPVRAVGAWRCSQRQCVHNYD
jgi:hypothetical protein